MLNIEAVLGKSELNHCVAVYVPATVNVSEAIDNTREVSATAEMLARYFGGATAVDVRGYWVSMCGLVTENTTRVYAFCSENDLELFLPEIVLYCRKLRDDMTQDCIGLEVDNKMYFI